MLDTDLFFLLNNLAGKSRLLDAIFVFLASDLQFFLIAAFLLLLFFSRKPLRDKTRMFAAAMLSGIIARGLLTEIIRFFWHRPRPFDAFSVVQLIPEDDWSFPSGHAAFFFAMAAAIYAYDKKWGIGFFLAAFLMNISRIAAGVHYSSDILGGAAVGISSAWIVLFLMKKYKIFAA